MSITSDIRAYADTAVSQGKQALDTAQAQLNDYTGAVGHSANDLVGKTRENVSDIAGKTAQAVADVRHSTEKAVNLDAITAAVEPYVAQFKEYTSAVTDKIDGLVTTARSDKRVAALVDRVEPVVGAVVELANERVVKPVQSFTGLGGKPTVKPAAKPGPKPTKSASTTTGTPRKSAATKPATKTTTTSATRKTAAKRTTS